MAASCGRIDAIPDNILLHILSYLPIKDRCLAGAVCRRWRRVVNDNSLWRFVDLRPYRLNLRKMWKVIRSHFSECLLEMKMKGFIRSSGPACKKYSLSPAMLQELRDRCPNLRCLHLLEMNLDNLDSGDLPQNSQELVLINCSWTPKWFVRPTRTRSGKVGASAEGAQLLPKLTYLNLAGCSRFDHRDAQSLLQWSELKVLVLNGCYRLKDNSIHTLVSGLPELERLEISEVSCTDLAVHHIARNLKKLRSLRVAECSRLTDDSLGSLATHKKLKELNLARCRQLTVEGLKVLKACRTLSMVNLTGIALSVEELDLLRQLMPWIEFTYTCEACCNLDLRN